MGAVQGKAGVSRRVLLGLGGLILLDGCTAARRDSQPSPWTAAGTGPSPPGAPPGGSSQPASPPSSPSTGRPAEQTPGDSHPTGVAPPTADTGPASAGPEFYVHKGTGAVALTIDDGPDPRYTPQILALLARYQVTATFCQVGRQIARYPGLVREVADAGHAIANHTFTHTGLAHASPATVSDEITRTSDLLQQITASRPQLFRAPYGAWSHQVLTECARQQLRPLDWSVDPRDWSRPGTSKIIATILRTTRTGSVILEHDGGGDRSQTVAALQTVLPALLDHGYHFVTP